MMLTIAMFAVTGFAALVAWVLGYAPLWVAATIYLAAIMIFLGGALIAIIWRQ